jgi:hypothetical protein
MGAADSGERGLARVGGLLALLVTGTNFSVSSGVGILALFGVSVQTGVIMLEYINQLRARGHTIVDAAVEGAVLRLRPIMMTMLVATLGCCRPRSSHAAALCHRIRFAAALRHRDRRRPDFRPGAEHRLPRRLRRRFTLCLDRARDSGLSYLFRARQETAASPSGGQGRDGGGPLAGRRTTNAASRFRWPSSSSMCSSRNPPSTWRGRT